MNDTVKILLICVAVGLLLTHSVFARIGESYDDCAKRYGAPVKSKEFDIKVSKSMIEKQSYFFVPARVSEFSTTGHVVTIFFGRFIPEAGVKPPWDGERAIALTFTRRNGSSFEKEAVASILAKQYDSPLKEGFPETHGHPNEEKAIADDQQRLSSFLAQQAELSNSIARARQNGENTSFLENDLRNAQAIANYGQQMGNRSPQKELEALVARDNKRTQEAIEEAIKTLKGAYDEVQSSNKDKTPITFRTKVPSSIYNLAITVNGPTLKVSLDDGNGDCSVQCLEKYRSVMKQLGDALSDEHTIDHEADILKKSEKVLETEGL